MKHSYQVAIIKLRFKKTFGNILGFLRDIKACLNYYLSSLQTLVNPSNISILIIDKFYHKINKNNLLLFKKFIAHINHHQLLYEYASYAFDFLLSIYWQELLVTLVISVINCSTWHHFRIKQVSKSTFLQ